METFNVTTVETFNNTTMEMEMADTCVDPDLCLKQSGQGNLGLAFGLTIGAGLATSLGAMLPFILPTSAASRSSIAPWQLWVASLAEFC